MQVTVPLKTEVYSPQPNSCLSPSSQEALRSLIKTAQSHLSESSRHTLMWLGANGRRMPQDTHISHTLRRMHGCPSLPTLTHPDWSSFHSQGPTLLDLIIWVGGCRRTRVLPTPQVSVPKVQEIQIRSN